MNIVTIIKDGAPPPTLSEAQRLIGGYVQLLVVSNDDQLLIDEEGRCKGLELNDAATSLAGTEIVGPAVLLQGSARWQVGS